MHGCSEARLDSQVDETHTAFTTHSLKPTEPYIPHLYQSPHIKHYLPLSPRKAARGERKRGSEGKWGKLSRDLNRSAKRGVQRGLGTRRKAPDSMVGRFCARRSFWRLGSSSGVREPTRFFPRAHSSTTITGTPPPPRRAAHCVRVVGRLPEMATPSRVRLGWWQCRRRAAPAAAARAGGRRVRWLGGLAGWIIWS